MIIKNVGRGYPGNLIWTTQASAVRFMKGRQSELSHLALLIDELKFLRRSIAVTKTFTLFPPTFNNFSTFFIFFLFFILMEIVSSAQFLSAGLLVFL
jgi:hypothetical protein